MTAMSLAALSGRFLYFFHRACGHAVASETVPQDLPSCGGDIVCYDCAQVLWCRAYDPWRRGSRGEGTIPADHWGRARPPQPLMSMFEGLQQVLRLAASCPAGPVGDDIRRAACELVEADSRAAQHAGRRRMLKAIARVEWRYACGRSRLDDPSSEPPGSWALQCAAISGWSKSRASASGNESDAFPRSSGSAHKTGLPNVPIGAGVDDQQIGERRVLAATLRVTGWA